MKTYTIDLSRIYENQPNKEWAQDGFYHPQHARLREKQEAPPCLHQDLAAEVTLKVWRALLENGARHQGGHRYGWTNLNFFIAGGRGSGKSTFLRYVSQCITGQITPFNDLSEEFRTGRRPVVVDLFFCDPSAMTSRENFFVSVIGALHTWVRRKVVVRSGGIHEGEHHHQHHELDERQQMYSGAHTHTFYMGTSVHDRSKEILGLIDKLAQGLSLLDESYNSSAAEVVLDPLSQLQHGMDNSNKAFRLKREFDRLIDMMAETYGMDAFLICVDDADIEFSKNKQITEVIRTYLTHPRIVILFTGDPVLAHETMREKQFAQFSLDFHKIDVANQGRRYRLVNGMTAQYMMKIFPVSNQVYLYRLHDAVSREQCEYKLILHSRGKEGNPEEVSLKTFINYIFSKTLSCEPGDARIFTEAFLFLPLRSVLLTLRDWDDSLVYEEYHKLQELDETIPKSEVEEQEKKNKETLHIQKLVDILAKSFYNANLSELLSVGYSRRELTGRSILFFCQGILRHCINCRNMSHGYHLSTSAIRYFGQESALLLAATGKRLIRTWGDALQFALLGVFSVQAYRHYQLRLASSSGNMSDYSHDSNYSQLHSKFEQNRFTDYLFSNLSDNPVRWAKKFSLILISERRRAQDGVSQPAFLEEGVLCITKKSDADILSEVFEYLSQKLDKELIPEEETKFFKEMDAMYIGDRLSIQERYFYAYLFLVILCGQANDQQNAYYLSIHNYLGYISRCYILLKECANEDARIKAAEDMIRKTVDRFILNNSAPSWSLDAFMGLPACNIAKAVPVSSIDKCVSNLALALNKWFEAANGECALSIPVTAREADKIYQEICDISNALSTLLNEKNNQNAKRPSDVVTIFEYILNRRLPVRTHQADNTLHREAHLAQCYKGFPMTQYWAVCVYVLAKVMHQARDVVARKMEEREEVERIEQSTEDIRNELDKTREMLVRFFSLKDRSAADVAAWDVLSLQQISRHLSTALNGVQQRISDVRKRLEKVKVQSRITEEQAANVERSLNRLVGGEKALRADLRGAVFSSLESIVSGRKKPLEEQSARYSENLAETFKSVEEFCRQGREGIHLEQMVSLSRNLMTMYSYTRQEYARLRAEISAGAYDFEYLSRDEMLTSLVGIDKLNELRMRAQNLSKTSELAKQEKRIRNSFRVSAQIVRETIASGISDFKRDYTNYSHGELPADEYNERIWRLLGPFSDNINTIYQNLSSSSGEGSYSVPVNFISDYDLTAVFNEAFDEIRSVKDLML